MEIKQKKRHEIPSEFKWNLEDIFTTPADWHKGVNSLPGKIAEVEAFKGKLKDGKALLDCLETLHKAENILSRLYVYANMRLHEDSNVSEAQGMADVMESQVAKFSTAASFIEPEILELDESTVQSFIKNTPGLDLYGRYLENILRKKAHILSAEIEGILAAASEMGEGASNVVSMLEDADMKFGSITNENGDTVEVTGGRFISLMESPDRRVRVDTFNLFYDGYWKLKNTFAALLNTSVKKDIFFSRTRKYATARDAALSVNNIPAEVYDSLVKTIHEFLPVMHRYMTLRKKALKLDELHMYDLYTPIVEEADTVMPYDEAKKKLVEGLAPLGKDYLNAMAKGMESGWLDVYENEGKRGGAYSWGTYGTHPYVLLNYDNKLGDLFTLAHEMGHAMHSYYTWETQPLVYGDYSIFLAEVASTVNETLLMEHMLKTTDDEKIRMYLLGEYIEQFRGTVFRQTMFAEFEHILHTMAENGEPLILDSINKVYRELNEKYYGPDMVVDEKIDLEWARISHFYRAFYVYQYATGYSAAIAFTKKIQTEGTPAVNAYIDFLKSGSSDYPINVLKKAGVDMSTPEPIREALKVFESLVTQMESAYA
ncbi:MAG: oligoendopeptidase F [Defluviitaleaceae bacterium]|nr:oligoendopeptidase F [Defluviitaleaceae bacterium]